MTATQVIRDLKKLAPAERRKVFSYVDAEIERREVKLDRAALAEARQDTRPPVAWTDVKSKLGLI
jgi:hypothetical protein